MFFTQQISFFIWSTLGGSLLAVGYDLLRLQRRLVKTKDFFVVVEDILFLILTSLLIFAIAYYKNEAKIRFYEFLAIIIGFCAFKILFKDYFLRLLMKIAFIIFKIQKTVLKIVLWPFLYLLKFLNKVKNLLKNFFTPILVKIKRIFEIKRCVIKNYIRCILCKNKKINNH